MKQSTIFYLLLLGLLLIVGQVALIAIPQALLHQIWPLREDGVSTAPYWAEVLATLPLVACVAYVVLATLRPRRA